MQVQPDSPALPRRIYLRELGKILGRHPNSLRRWSKERYRGFRLDRDEARRWFMWSDDFERWRDLMRATENSRADVTEGNRFTADYQPNA